MQDKNGKKDEADGTRPPATRAVAGFVLPPIPEEKAPRGMGAAGVDELSGSLLVDEPSSVPRKSLLPIIGLAGVLAGIGLAILAVRAARSHGSPRSTVSSPSAATSSSVAPVASRAEGPTPSTFAPSPILTACTVAGDPQLIAPRAIVAAGIEVRAFGNDVALGFAPNDHEAMLVRLDPATLSVSQSTVAHSTHSIRRVTPIPGRTGKLDLAVDVDRNGDPLQGRRTVPLDPPVQVGVADSQLMWAPLNRGIQGPLWRLEGEGPVEALRGARSESNLAMVAIAFRRAGAVWLGTAERSSTLAPRGDLSRVNGLGPMVGSPAIAVNEGTAIAAWADRPSPDDPWQMRWVRFKAGEAAGEPRAFKPPPGGKGEDAMSPGLAVVPGGRFLLVWTEGPASAHAVRALTLSADGAPTGKAIAISADGVNAGQGQAALTASGRGVVAFLQSSTNGDTTGFHVAVAPIVCSP